MSSNYLAAVTVCFAICFCCATNADAQTARTTNYRGWKAIELSNGLIEIQGRAGHWRAGHPVQTGRLRVLLCQRRVGGKAAAAERALAPMAGGSTMAARNSGPPPQGWDNEKQWPGPPDAVLDGSSHSAQGACQRRRLGFGRAQEPKGST